MVLVEAGPQGRAGRVLAAHLPRRPGSGMAGVSIRPGQAWPLDDLVRGAALGIAEETVAVSANDRPGETPVPVGFFFSPPDRARRMRALLAEPGVTAARMQALPRDVLQPAALGLRDALLARLPGRVTPAARALAAWDGGYDAGSAGALAFEAMVASLARVLIPRAQLELLAAVWTGRALVAHRVAKATPAQAAAALREADRLLRRFGSWGAAHRLALRHPFAALPLVGRRYRLPDLPAAGGNDTLNKTGHPPVAGRHRVTYGAGARHVSDLADPDANWFVLLGGQDGWLGSANAADQVALWQRGEYLQVPLEAGPTRAWPHETVLTP
jgi:penicillin amidase